MVQWSGGFLAGSVPGEVVNTTFFDQTFFEVFESKCLTDLIKEAILPKGAIITKEQILVLGDFVFEITSQR